MNTLVLALAAAGGALVLLYLICLLRKVCSRRATASRWANGPGLEPLVAQDAQAQSTHPDPAQNSFSTYTNDSHGFQIDYPKHWILREGAPGESLIVHFSCPDTEPSFKRLSVVCDVAVAQSWKGVRTVVNCDACRVPHSAARAIQAWDDLTWVDIDARQFAEHVRRACEHASAPCAVCAPCPSIDETHLSPALPHLQVLAHLPDVVPGSHVISNRPVRVGRGKFARDGHEFVYAISNEEECSFLKLVNHVVVAGTKAFTATFSIADVDFDVYLPLSRHLLSSFTVRAPATPPPRVTETPTQPGAITWRDYAWPAARVSVKFPATWWQETVENANVVRFTCQRGESAFKSINYFVIDLSAIPSGDLLEDLVHFYEDEVEKQVRGPAWALLNCARMLCAHAVRCLALSRRDAVVLQGAVRVLDRREVAGIEQGSQRRAYMFRSEGRRGLISITSLAFVGVIGPKGTVGHIATFTADTRVFEQYRAVADHMFRSISVVGSRYVSQDA